MSGEVILFMPFLLLTGNHSVILLFIFQKQILMCFFHAQNIFARKYIFLIIYKLSYITTSLIIINLELGTGSGSVGMVYACFCVCFKNICQPEYVQA